MTSKQKIELFDRIYEMFKEQTDDRKILRCVGTLNKAPGY